MTKRKGEEQLQQPLENMPVQTTRAAKEKEKGSQNASALSAAAKLEKFAHSATLSPAKNNQLTAGKSSAGGLGDRRSLGKGPDSQSASTRATNKKSPEREQPGRAGDSSPTVDVVCDQEPTLKEVLCAINACRSSIGGMWEELKALSEEFGSIKQELQKTVERVKTVEERVSQVEDIVTPMRLEFKKMQAQLDANSLKMDEWENRSRRQNVRVMGLPEKSEGSCPEEFMEKWLKEVFGAEAFSQFFSIERAHRVPSRPAYSGDRPRPMILRFFCYKDKLNLMQRSREKGDIFFNGARIAIYPDYSPDLQRRRAGFLDIKRTLRNHNISYALLYPARLRIEALGTIRFFESVKGATDWFEENKRNL